MISALAARAAMFAIFVPMVAASQEQSNVTTGVNVQTITLDSRKLGERRVVDIALPRGYSESEERYPVIVVLDGEWQFDVAASLAGFYATASMMPRTIVVGVRNTRRMHDMTPAPVPGFRVPPQVEDPGGADNFVAFLADELVPHLDRSYRTAPMRVLVGHSLGGLVALHALSTRSSAFVGYVVMEPAVWWNDQKPLRDAVTMLGTSEAGRARVMFVNAPRVELDTTHWGGTKPMVRRIGVTGETHESMAAAGMLIAFRTLFSDFRPSSWKPGTRPIAMIERYDSLAARVGYEVPIPESAFERVIRMSIHARHFDDAQRTLARMERATGQSASSNSLRQLLEAERAKPVPAGWIPLEIPSRRPTPQQASAFLGTWEKVGPGPRHRVSIEASGDTIVVHDRVEFPNGDANEGDRQVIQVTQDGQLEWGLPWFQGLAALLVLKAQIAGPDSMSVTREPRGWVPQGPTGPEMQGTVTFKRVRD